MRKPPYVCAQYHNNLTKPFLSDKIKKIKRSVKRLLKSPGNKVFLLYRGFFDLFGGLKGHLGFPPLAGVRRLSLRKSLAFSTHAKGNCLEISKAVFYFSNFKFDNPFGFFNRSDAGDYFHDSVLLHIGNRLFRAGLSHCCY